MIETERMFELCDQENKGYLTPDNLKAVCPQLDDQVNVKNHIAWRK